MTPSWGIRSYNVDGEPSVPCPATRNVGGRVRSGLTLNLGKCADTVGGRFQGLLLHRRKRVERCRQIVPAERVDRTVTEPNRLVRKSLSASDSDVLDYLDCLGQRLWIYRTPSHRRDVFSVHPPHADIPRLETRSSLRSSSREMSSSDTPALTAFVKAKYTRSAAS